MVEQDESTHVVDETEQPKGSTHAGIGALEDSLETGPVDVTGGGARDGERHHTELLYCVQDEGLQVSKASKRARLALEARGHGGARTRLGLEQHHEADGAGAGGVWTKVETQGLH